MHRARATVNIYENISKYQLKTNSGLNVWKWVTRAARKVVRTFASHHHVGGNWAKSTTKQIFESVTPWREKKRRIVKVTEKERQMERERIGCCSTVESLQCGGNEYYRLLSICWSAWFFGVQLKHEILLKISVDFRKTDAHDNNNKKFVQITFCCYNFMQHRCSDTESINFQLTTEPRNEYQI